MDRLRAEAPTFALLVFCYAGLLAVTGPLWDLAPALALPALAALVALYASLQHEVIHGHPFRDARWNAWLVFPAVTLVIPFARFRDTHLAHHQNSRLTDPYDDPETNYLAGEVWARLPGPARTLLRMNNTLAGRIVLGPAIGTAIFLAGELRGLVRGDPTIRRAWAWHIPAVALVLAWVAIAPVPVAAYAAGVYGGLAILRIRTFLEHQAHDRAGARSVVIEDRGPLALLFLYNNFHLVHHMHPRVPWYRLPALYAANRARYLGRNDGYCYRGYAEVIGRHLWRGKDPVVHPNYPAP